jgi:hypothetical protein
MGVEHYVFRRLDLGTKYVYIVYIGEDTFLNDTWSFLHGPNDQDGHTIVVAYRHCG